MCAPSPHDDLRLSFGEKKAGGENETRLKSFVSGAPPSKKNSGSALDSTAQNKNSKYYLFRFKGSFWQRQS